MLKKVHILNPADTPSTEKNSNECSLCKTIMTTDLYVCASGHVICKSCHNIDTSLEDSNERGDNVPEKGSGTGKNQKKIKNIDSDTKTQDFASGDNDGVFTKETNSEIKTDGKIPTDVIKKEYQSKSNPEITVAFKNTNYQESESSLSAGSSKNIEGKEDISNGKITRARPVLCPVTNCAKIVTIDSLLLHFHFDHSKVPRIILDDVVPQEIYLKSSNFSTDLQCVATFYKETDKRSIKILKDNLDSIPSLRNTFKDNKLLLLMAVRLPTSPVKLPNLKCDTSRIFTRSIHTQTEIHGLSSEVRAESLSKSSDYQSCTSKSLYDEDEVLLFWLCKLDDEERVYSITLLGEDKKQGYCYIGDAIHIRDKQDPSILYDKSECLMVKGSAVNSLYDNENQVTVIVSIIG